MKICAAQTIPIKGNIQQNIEKHKSLIEIAISNQADMIIFPELSLTGYEPGLADGLSISDLEDESLNDFQIISDLNDIIIGVGIPFKTNKGISISMVIFQPNDKRQVYAKQYLHSGEEEYFTSGENILPLIKNEDKIAIAICYETSIPEHAEKAFKNGAHIYIASVLNSVESVDKDIKRISETAKKYNMYALMSNFAGESGGYECAGKTSIWNKQGALTGQLNSKDEGVIIIDTESDKIIEKYL
ncbi:carbon-nitrogen hydrolase family protein [Flavobacterium hibisci]|uniref:carbon-nitrogen hydrolase family protein n=1 Tax=Flavobacterium hibisci TaxID=1914462 RepID=UPI001CBB5452|nr:carbon-nitrogen hydrolase family protein [Flavobacterium hibisci]MBZ4043779.1 carbon-nitrogen hydrolase family protein [Flavobacterium hibisci]